MSNAIRLGFTRGVAPSKWEKRWRVAMPGVPLELVPVETPFGRPSGSAAETAALDVMIERVAPGARPESSDPEHEPRTHHALRLYEESLALVVSADHDLATETEIRVDDLALVRILDHPHHAPEWPAAEPWEDPTWMPQTMPAALELVATGLGGIIAPLPLARHLAAKREHAVLRIVAPEGELPGTTVWASWPVERDADDVQQLVGILRGRTARSSRRPADAATPRQQAPTKKKSPAQQPAKKAAQLKPNSRGAQLAAAREKAEQAKAAKRRAKKKKR